MNELDSKTVIGTFGELLVQLRLFQCGVQAAPPLKDSGNDLIAVRGRVLRAVQVKTTTQNRFSLDQLPERYHLLALVAVDGKISDARLDETKVFLLSRRDVEALGTTATAEDVADWALNAERIGHVFQVGE